MWYVSSNCTSYSQCLRGSFITKDMLSETYFFYSTANNIVLIKPEVESCLSRLMPPTDKFYVKYNIVSQCSYFMYVLGPVSLSCVITFAIRCFSVLKYNQFTFKLQLFGAVNGYTIYPETIPHLFRF